MRWEGFAYAAAAAIAHSCIDASRKLASQRFTSAELVGLVGVLDAAFLSLLVYGTGTTFYAGTHTFVHRAQLHLFLAIVVCGACVKVLVGFMYQRALHVSPLSVTVPYLAFTPVLLLFTGYIVVHESPSSQGLLGVFVVTLGGYLLAIDQTHGGEAVVEWKQKMKGSSLLKPSGNLPNSTSETLLISAIPALAAVLNFKAGSEKKTSSWPAAASIVPDQDVNDDDDDVAADEKQEQTLQAGAGHDDENSVKISLPLTLKGRNLKWREW